MEAQDISDNLAEIRHNVVDDIVSEYLPQNELREQWDIKGLDDYIEQNYGLSCELENFVEGKDFVTEAEIKEQIINSINQEHIEKINLVDEEAMQNLEKTPDVTDFGYSLERTSREYGLSTQGIHLRGYARKTQPKNTKRRLLCCC